RLGQLAAQRGRLQEAYDLTVESIATAHDVGRHMAYGEFQLGIIQLYLRKLEAAERSLQEALLFFEDISHDARGQVETLGVLSEVALARGDVRAAAAHLGASLNRCQVLYHQLQATRKLEGTPDALPVNLIGLCVHASLVAAAQGHNERAVTLYSIADS